MGGLETDPARGEVTGPMLALSCSGRTPLRSILCLGAHSDDIEIGCGGTVLTLLKSHPEIHVTWVVLAGQGERGVEARQSAELFLQSAGAKRVVVREFRDGYFPHQSAEIKDYFETLKRETSPDLVFTHARNDLHQDHRVVCELTWNTFRNHFVLEYEIPKYDGDLGTPNCFVPLTEETVARKIEILMSVFASQRNKHWFTGEMFRSILRLRGMECAHPGYAEAFVARKLTLG